MLFDGGCSLFLKTLINENEFEYLSNNFCAMVCIGVDVYCFCSMFYSIAQLKYNCWQEA